MTTEHSARGVEFYRRPGCPHCAALLGPPRRSIRRRRLGRGVAVGGGVAEDPGRDLAGLAVQTAAHAASIEPRAASTAASFRSPCERFSSGRFNTAFAGCTFGLPDDR